MKTISELKEMGKFEFASFILTLTVLDIVNILEKANIFIKKNEKKDIALKVLFDVIEGVRVSTEEDIKKLATRKKMAETKKLNKENEKKRELELESMWNELNQEEKSLIYLYYCFENGVKVNPVTPMYDLVKGKLPYEFMKDVKDLMSFCEFEFDDFKGFKKYIKYVHPDTHMNYKINEFVDLSKYASEYLKLFRVGNN